MKRLLILSITLFALSGCKKDPATPTPVTTTSYAGEYSMTGTDTFTRNGQTNIRQIEQSSQNVTLHVLAGNSPNTYYFLERYGSTESGYFVNVSGNTFKLETTTSEVVLDNARYVGYQNGTGRFDGKSISIEKTIGPYSLQLGSQAAPGSMTRKFIINATPK